MAKWMANYLSDSINRSVVADSLKSTDSVRASFHSDSMNPNGFKFGLIYLDRRFSLMVLFAISDKSLNV